MAENDKIHRAMEGETADIPRVLVIFPGAIGDLICFGPALREIAGRNPGAAVELMARAELARFAVGRMGVARAHSIDRREMGDLFTENGADSVEARRFFGDFAQVYSFFAADDENFRRSLSKIAGNRASFYAFRPDVDGHVADGYLRALGVFANGPVESRVEVLTSDLAAARSLLADLGVSPRDFVLILPGSGSPKKNWPIERFLELAAAISRLKSVIFVLGPAESSYRRALDAANLRAIDRLELGEVAGIAHLARCFVGNDSGVSHLAAAAGAPGVVIFGPTEPERWRPLGRITVLRRQPIEQLEVREVENAVVRLLDDSAH